MVCFDWWACLWTKQILTSLTLVSLLQISLLLKISPSEILNNSIFLEKTMRKAAPKLRFCFVLFYCITATWGFTTLGVLWIIWFLGSDQYGWEPSTWLFFCILTTPKLSGVSWNSVFKGKMDNSIQKHTPRQLWLPPKTEWKQVLGSPCYTFSIPYDFRVEQEGVKGNQAQVKGTCLCSILFWFFVFWSLQLLDLS